MSRTKSLVQTTLALALVSVPVLAQAQMPAAPAAVPLTPPPLPAASPTLQPTTPQGAPVAATPQVQDWIKFTDPQENAFSLDMPQDWNNLGGTFRLNAMQFRNWASATSPDGTTIVAINDPREGAYIAPTPLLAATGFRVGSLYGGGGSPVYTVAPYQSGEQFVVSWGRSRLASICSGARVTSSRSLGNLVPGANALGFTHDVGEARFSCQRNGQEMTGYALAYMTYLGNSGIWYAETIEAFLAPAKDAGAAAAVLSHMVGSVQVDPTWLANVSNNAVAVANKIAETNAAISQMIMQEW